jgi:Flp pilus assembly protein TadD
MDLRAASLPSWKHSLGTRTGKAAGLALLVLVSYLPAIAGGFVWDDDDYVTANANLTEPGGLARIWLEPKASPQFYPMVFTGFWVERRLWGLHPAGYHAVNVALHLCNALLLWRLLALAGAPLAWSAAAVFALHPLQVESVAWVAERKNVLSGCFYLLAGISYLPVLGIGPETASAGRPRRRVGTAWAGAFALFACALLSKSVTATLPVVLLLLAWWRRGRVTARDAALTLPFFALGAVSGLFTAWLEKAHVGAASWRWALTLDERVVIAGKNFWFYLAKFLWPSSLSFTYPRWQPHGYPWWHLAAPLAAVGLALLLWRLRARLGRGPLAALLFSAATLAPALGFVDFYPMRFSFVADHFAYLAIIGPALGLAGAAAAGARLAREMPAGRAAERGARAAAGALVLVLAVLTWQRCGAFRDEETLWRDTLAKNPAATSARVNLALLLTNRGANDEALGLLAAALAAEPGAPDILYNLGNVHRALGHPVEAESGYRAAVLAAPNFSRARVALAALLLDRRRPSEAAVELREAARRSPDFPGVHPLLGAALVMAGDDAGAIQAFEEGLRRTPRDGEAHRELGLLYSRRGEPVKARQHLLRAVELSPADPAARFDLGQLLERLGDPDAAAERYREALRIQPDFAEAHNELGVNLALRGDAEEAAAHFREALRLRPGYREAAANLEALGSRAPGEGRGAGRPAR